MTTGAVTTPILLDVDTGIDDSLALLYAVASPRAELVGVSCVGGNVAVDQVAINTAAVLDMAGRPDVEVAVGRSRPLARALVTTPETHGPTGTGHAELSCDPGRLSARSGVELIVDHARARPGELTVVALGPLTNLVAALEVEPDLLSLLKRVVIMGGCFAKAGNTAPRTEWNMHVDPEAAKAFFAAVPPGLDPLPLIMPLDVTEFAKLLPGHVSAIAQAGGSELVSEEPLIAEGPELLRFLADALRFYMDFHLQYDGFYGAFVHDPFAVAAALDATLVEGLATTVDVETKGELTMAETVADFRNAWNRPPNAVVATAGRADVFLSEFIELIGALARH